MVLAQRYGENLATSVAQANDKLNVAKIVASTGARGFQGIAEIGRRLGVGGPLAPCEVLLAKAMPD